MNYFLRITILSVSLLSVIYFAFFRTQETEPSEGYEISVDLKPFKNCQVTLAHYYGNNLLTDATATLDDNGEAVFNGVSKLHQGIYVVYDEFNRGRVDFLVDADQHFTVKAEFRDYDQTIHFLGSEENQLFNSYQQFMAFKEADINHFQKQLAVTVDPNDSLVYIQQLILINDSIQIFRNNLISENPGTLLSALLSALKEPVLPADLKNPKNSADSAAVTNYTKMHFWDDVNFWDGRLAYTPFFAAKLDKYYSEVVDRKADSVIKQIDGMMSTAVANEDMTHLILGNLFFGTMYHRYKWDDQVFIHLFEKYISQETYHWLNPADKKMLTEYAYQLIANNKGTKAYEFDLAGVDGQKKSLLAESGKYTLLCFWDVTCSHCRETMPVLDSLYRLAWKKEGLKMYAVSVESDGNRDEWLSYINEHQLGDWNHVYYSMAEQNEHIEKNGRSSLQPYDIWYYPSFFLLDQEKRLMAKKLKYPQIADLVNSIIEKE